MKKISQEKLKEFRKIAKFFGGKSLTGTARQKSWAEEVRSDFLKSDCVSDESKTEFIGLGGKVNGSKFWIENRLLSPTLFVAELYQSEIDGLEEIECQHWDFLVATNPTGEKNRRRDMIRDYIESCTFKFSSELAEE